MSQPNGAPAEEWVERADGTTALNVMRVDLEHLADKTASKNYVLGTIGGAAAMVILGAWVVSGSARAEMAEARKQTAEDVRQVRTETSAKVERIEGKVDGMWKVIVERQAPGVVAAEYKRKTNEER